MLVTLLVWLIAWIASYSIGLLTLRFFQRLFPGAKAVFPVALISAVGLTVLTAILGYCSLFAPMNHPILQVSIFSWVFWLTITFRKEFSKLFYRLKTTWQSSGWIHKSFLVVFFLFILIKSSGQVQIADSGAYHLPFLKWTEQYPVIKGLANVHTRFGFNYQYHVLYAFLGFANWFGTTLHALNGFMYLLGFIYFYELYRKHHNNLLLKMCSIISLLFISQMNKGMTGFSPDFPVTVLQMMVVFECLSLLISKNSIHTPPPSNTYDLSTVVICTLAIGCVTFKLASVALIFVLFLSLFRQLFQWRILLLLTICCLIVFTPFLIRNYYISGYLVYPFYSVDIFDVPWKVPLWWTINEKVVVKNYALGYPNWYKGAYHYNWDLFKTWLTNEYETNRAYIPVYFLLAGCIVLSLIQWLRSAVIQKHLLPTDKGLILTGLFFGVIFWWCNAPDLRFGNGVIVPFIAIVIASLYLKVISKFNPNIRTRFNNLSFNSWALLIILFSALSLSGNTFSKQKNQPDQLRFTLIHQSPYPKPDTVSVITDGYTTYQCDSDTFGRCWECPLPCSYTADKYHFIVPGKVTEGFVSGFQPGDEH